MGVEKMKFSKEFFSINRPVVLIKAVVFTWNFGMSTIWGFLSLQLRGLGMNYNDISIIYGILPYFTFFSTPFSGIIISFSLKQIFVVLKFYSKAFLVISLDTKLSRLSSCS